MFDAGDTPSPISFTYKYEGHGMALASISNGAVAYDMRPSYGLGDPLFVLVRAVVQALRNGAEVTGCEWWYEPAVDRWMLRREGDSVHITIRRMRDRHPNPNLDIWSPARFWLSGTGEVRFTATGDLWTFAAHVRRAVNRLKPAEEDDPTWPRRTAEYRALCDFLDEHKRIHQGRREIE
jgi:hypothetical protein